MRCPKCQYIGFDSGDRCRNCGYEFSLVVDDPPVDVSLSSEDDDADLAMQDLTLAADERPASDDAGALDERLETPAGGRRAITAADLPLFTERFADDQAPLVTPPAVPRPPLSVRRTSPMRQRGRSAGPRLDLASTPEPQLEPSPRDVEAAHGTAGIVRRAAAGLVDVVVLGTVAVIVVLLTLRLSALTMAEWQVLPMVPLAAFLLLVCGGYFVLFTAAGGQTIGKMVTRIRVVTDTHGAAPARAVPFSTAMVRAMACFGSVAALGAGFLAVLFSPDRRAFHDRVAGTRVISA